MRDWTGMFLRLTSMLCLLLGVAIAGTYGARNGTTHSQYRADQWEMANAQAADSAAVPTPLPTGVERLQGWLQVGAPWFRVGFVLILLGAFLSRMVSARENEDRPTAGATSTKDFSGVLQTVLHELTELVEQIANTPMDDDAPEARAIIDRLVNDHIEPLIDSRGRLIARHGIGGFAEYFGPFSSGERKLHRVWSGLTDGHAVVAREALTGSIADFQNALSTYEQVEGR